MAHRLSVISDLAGNERGRQLKRRYIYRSRIRNKAKL